VLLERKVGVGFLVCILGVLFGWLVSSTNHGLGPWSDYSSKVIGSSWAWLALATLCCLGGRGWRAASLRGFAFLAPAVGAYYLSDVLQGVYGTSRIDAPGLLSDVVAYCVLACLASAALGAVAVLGRRRGPLGLTARVAVPAYIAQSALRTFIHARSSTVGPGPIARDVSVVVGILALLTTMAVVLIGRTRQHREGVTQ
jgi:hypothetical protein